MEGTANFIKIILKFWKIVNVKGEGADTRFRDDSRGVIRSSNDPRLLFLLDLADMADKMKNTGGKRIRQLTEDTAESLSHLCHGFVELAKYLLDCGNAYVFGWFTTDPLEKCFSKLRRGSGGTYFITAQSVIEKVRIQHAKLTLQLGIEVSGKNGHSCGNCSRNLDEKESEIMDNLSALEENIQEDTLLSIIYIAGYIQKKNGYEYDDTVFYYQKFGSYFDSLDRGGLCTMLYSGHCSALSYFCQFSEQLCRTFLVKQFLFISEKFNFGLTENHSRTLSNILLKNYSILRSPGSSKETQLKILKLTCKEFIG